VVTYTLIGINVVVFGLQYMRGINEVAGDFGMWPVAIAVYGEWWRLVTAAFLHGSLLHIAFNMYVLYALGPTLERILGHGRFVLLYLLAAIGGAGSLEEVKAALDSLAGLPSAQLIDTLVQGAFKARAMGDDHD